AARFFFFLTLRRPLFLASCLPLCAVFVLVPLVVPAGQVALSACYAGCARWPRGADIRPGRAQTCSIAVFGGRLSARPVLSGTSGRLIVLGAFMASRIRFPCLER
ncbi:hypothetical protein HDV63DRAFT_363271, partial [Trichoderma sp. SZMC 28014]